ncbi:ORFL157W [Human betaherpesvirus 5]|nr:ORFL157W [Human betaherpesvirus 5]QHX40492.1 ORFL157W [Human betaherpesvirus 5]
MNLVSSPLLSAGSGVVAGGCRCRTGKDGEIQ